MKILFLFSALSTIRTKWKIDKISFAIALCEKVAYLIKIAIFLVSLCEFANVIEKACFGDSLNVSTFSYARGKQF
jgi:hypothetical protein